MLLPQRNAILLAVTRGGASEDYATNAGGGSSNLLGNTFDAYVGERRTTFAEAQALNRATISYAIVPGDTRVDFVQGDVLTFERRGVTFERTVREVRTRQVDGLPPQPVRLDLEDA